MKPNQLVLFGGIFAAVLAVLSAGYLLFFKQDYVVLYDNIREQDSAAIIAELEGDGIDFELGANGTRVLVPEDAAGRARVVVAGAGIPMGGVVGFELFNESDMGLTDFAQKVNFQRALQGELARTIMMMEGIGFSRVHLSLPERTLFRADGAGPKAAVTVQAKPGHRIGNDRVFGIQQLVSSAVTGLAASDVAVLDESGELVSKLLPDAEAEHIVLDERSALEEYYRARANKAAEQVLPDLAFQIRVDAVDLPASAEDSSESDAPARNFSIRVTFRTEVGIAQNDEDDVRNALATAVDLKPTNGDSLGFEVGPFESALANAPTGPTRVDSEESPKQRGVFAETAPSAWEPLSLFGSIWFWLGLLALLAIALPLLRQRSRLTEEEQQSFAEILGEQLSIRQESQRG